MSQAKGDNTQTVNASKVRPITRRNLIAGGTAVLAVAGAALPSQALSADPETDPIVNLWRQYRPAESAVCRINQRAWEIEQGLPEHPGVNLGLVLAVAPAGIAPFGSPTIVRGADEIERFAAHWMQDNFGFNDALRAEWITARKAELVKVDRQWEECRKASGILELQDEEMEWDGVVGDLYAQIERGTATTPAGLAVKLLIAFEHTDHGGPIEDLPYCLYVSMLRDLLPFCPPDVATWAKAFVEADERTACVGECLDTARAQEGGDI